MPIREENATHPVQFPKRPLVHGYAMASGEIQVAFLDEVKAVWALARAWSDLATR
jgi:hypothetical protein